LFSSSWNEKRIEIAFFEEIIYPFALKLIQNFLVKPGKIIANLCLE